MASRLVIPSRNLWVLPGPTHPAHLELGTDTGRLLLLVQMQQRLGGAVVQRHADDQTQGLGVQQVLGHRHGFTLPSEGPRPIGQPQKTDPALFRQLRRSGSSDKRTWSWEVGCCSLVSSRPRNDHQGPAQPPPPAGLLLPAWLNYGHKASQPRHTLGCRSPWSTEMCRPHGDGAHLVLCKPTVTLGPCSGSRDYPPTSTRILEGTQSEARMWRAPPTLCSRACKCGAGGAGVYLGNRLLWFDTFTFPVKILKRDHERRVGGTHLG